MNKIGLKLAGLVVVAATLLTPVSVSAALSNSLGVNPRRDYTIKPGDKLSDTLYVNNLSKTDDLIITIDVIDFGPKDETGSPALLLKQSEPTRWSLKPYLTIAKQQTIAAGKSAEIPFTLTIPGNLGAGSFYSAIKYSAGGDASNENVSLASSSATLMFVRVPGESKSSLALEKFGAFSPDSTGTKGDFDSIFFGSSPKYLSYRLKNQGNVTEQPTGSIEVKNIFGKQVKLYENANPNNNLVLIDQTRRVDLCLNEERSSRKDTETNRNIEEIKCLDSKLAPGRYTATLGLVYGDNGNSSQEIKSAAVFWYLPAWFILIVLAVVAGLVAGASVIRSKLKSKRRSFRR